MTDAQQAPKSENLELNRETIQDLAAEDAEQVQGGLMGHRPCTEDFSGCQTTS
jgi:hypothetical protein